MADSTQYEFTGDQNQLIGSLAGKMRLVGLVMVVMGVLTLLMAILLALAGQTDAKLKELPPATFWSLVAYYALTAVFNLLLGMWTRNAAGSFQQIVDTRGQDISRLMDALGAMHKIYSLLYTICVVFIILFVLFVVGVVAGTFLMAK